MNGGVTATIGDCVISDGEIVNTVEIVQNSPPFTGGMKFITNLKTCGPYGLFDESKKIVLAGDQLLFVYGRKGGVYDRMSLAFGYC